MNDIKELVDSFGNAGGLVLYGALTTWLIQRLVALLENRITFLEQVIDDLKESRTEIIRQQAK